MTSGSYAEGVMMPSSYGEDVMMSCSYGEGIMIHTVVFLSNAKPGDNVLCSIRQSICPSTLSRPNRLTFDLDIWHEGQP